jgi:hypothetical protein
MERNDELVDVCYDAPMPYYGKISGTNNGVEGT